MTVIPLNIKPKQVTSRYLDHNFIITHNRDADLDKRWHYQILFDKLYLYLGDAATLKQAERRARAQIRKLVSAQRAFEERVVLYGD
jgi:hypothetical protein